MEELQSTDKLVQEIQEDARKKAHRILKTAEETIQTKSTEWEEKLRAAMDDLAKKYVQQDTFARDEIMARLPMDKRRIKAKKIEELLNAAVEAWYAGLSRERVLELLKKELEKRLAVNNAFTFTGETRARIHKIDRKEAETVLRSALSGKLCAIEEVHSVSPYPEIILETQEVRIYASIGNIVEFFLDKNRAELVDALLGNTEIAGEEW
jgi:vacuolar-type H+-ATPase subunit E/Vma4